LGSPTTNRRQLTFKRAESNEPHLENKKKIHFSILPRWYYTVNTEIRIWDDLYILIDGYDDDLDEVVDIEVENESDD
jgi:hypothetical protein